MFHTVRNLYTSYKYIVLITAIFCLAGILIQLFTFHRELINQTNTAFDTYTSHVNEELLHSAQDLDDVIQASELATLIAQDTDENRNAFAQKAIEITEHHTTYTQVRFIDEEGQEIVRIDRQDGQIIQVDEAHLQNKINRYYVTDTLKLNEGEVYISPLDLNIENGEVEEPFNPMIRMAAPVFTQGGEHAGLIIINIQAQDLLYDPGVTTELSPRSRFLLVNSDGYWFKGFVPEDEWGFMFPKRESKKIQNVFPKAWQNIQSSSEGLVFSNEGMFIYRTIFPIRIVQSELGDNAQSYFSRNLTSKDFYWVTIGYISIADSLGFVYETIIYRYIIIFSVIVLSCGLFILFSTLYSNLQLAHRKKEHNQKKTL
ncbi:cache domain-containing protein [candidate division WWE3 bacterium]|uniref:Cache domain-containing protein n=1 Tax=candidate division WWE3 bacterium TaxID=2053526 RepID=A0A955LGJ9_UNCKA|nr:cache domain-containing protein [candidate division WWE3 bacterium]